MKRLNQREKEIAAVTRDLFLKGSTEYRIAEYAFSKRLTSEQFSNFLEKLEILPENVRLTIYNHYRDILHNQCYDQSKGFGHQLNHWLKRNMT
jgi:hypothetical protein